MPLDDFCSKVNTTGRLDIQLPQRNTGMLGARAVPIAAYRITLNVPSSAGAKVTLATMQSGIG